MQGITICQVKSAKVHKKSSQLFSSLVFFFLVGLKVGILPLTFIVAQRAEAEGKFIL